jgi:methionyl-tRNA formyltransferase
VSKRVLYLGPESPLVGWLERQGEKVWRTEAPATPGDVKDEDVVVSYGYRHILPPEVIGECAQPPVNLHISLLPWNRGADPNLWSWVNDTPKGVTIHEIDEGVDTGPIIDQREVSFQGSRHLTLRHTYQILQAHIEELFHSRWRDIREGRYVAQPQQLGVGSYHSSQERKYVERQMEYGWDTPVEALGVEALK